MTATDINHALGRLYIAVAQDRIPIRNANTLARIGGIMLRAVPTIKDEFPFAYTFDQWQERLQTRRPLSRPAVAPAPQPLPPAISKRSPKRATEKRIAQKRISNTIVAKPTPAPQAIAEQPTDELATCSPQLLAARSIDDSPTRATQIVTASPIGDPATCPPQVVTVLSVDEPATYAPNSTEGEIKIPIENPIEPLPYGLSPGKRFSRRRKMWSEFDIKDGG